MAREAMQFEIKGWDDLQRAMKSVSNEARKTSLLKRTGKKAARIGLQPEMKRRYKALGLKLSGKPENPIFKKRAGAYIRTTAKGSNMDDTKIIVGAIGREAAKLYWVEYGTNNGTRSLRPRPFFRASIDRAGNPTLKMWLLELWDEISDKWGGYGVRR